MKDTQGLQGRIDAFLERKTRQYPEIDRYVDQIERL